MILFHCITLFINVGIGIRIKSQDKLIKWYKFINYRQLSFKNVRNCLLILLILTEIFLKKTIF